MAFRRADLVALGPLDEKFAFYRSLDAWWSLVLRAGADPAGADHAGGRARRPARGAPVGTSRAPGLDEPARSPSATARRSATSTASSTSSATARTCWRDPARGARPRPAGSHEADDRPPHPSGPGRRTGGRGSKHRRSLPRAGPASGPVLRVPVGILRRADRPRPKQGRGASPVMPRRRQRRSRACLTSPSPRRSTNAAPRRPRSSSGSGNETNGRSRRSYSRYSGPLYSLAYQVTGAERYAQEVVQEVFVAVWKDAGRFDPSRGALSSWLFALARHKAIDLVRKEANVRKHTADVDLELHEAEDDVDQEAWRRLRRDTVRAAILQLPGGAAHCARARLLRRPDPRRGGREAGHPPRHRQDPDPHGAPEAPGHPRPQRVRDRPPRDTMDHRTYRELAAGAALGDIEAAERASLDAHLDDLSRPAAARPRPSSTPRACWPSPCLRGRRRRRSARACSPRSRPRENRPAGVSAASLAYAGAGPAPAGVVPGAAQPDHRRCRGGRHGLDRRRRRARCARVANDRAIAASPSPPSPLRPCWPSPSAPSGPARPACAAISRRPPGSATPRWLGLATTDQAMAVVMAPDHATATLKPDPIAADASVYVVYRPGTTDSWLMAGNLPAPPSGMVYQLWSADEAGVHALDHVHLRWDARLHGAVRRRPRRRRGDDDHARDGRRSARRARSPGRVRHARRLSRTWARGDARDAPYPARAPRLAPSSESSSRLASTPPAYPVSEPSAPTTRWHGTTIEIGFRATACPTARAAPGRPIRLASSAVGHGGPAGDRPQLLPDPLLERGSAPERERDVGLRAGAGESARRWPTRSRRTRPGPRVQAGSTAGPRRCPGR